MVLFVCLSTLCRKSPCWLHCKMVPGRITARLTWLGFHDREPTRNQSCCLIYKSNILKYTCTWVNVILSIKYFKLAWKKYFLFETYMIFILNVAAWNIFWRNYLLDQKNLFSVKFGWMKQIFNLNLIPNICLDFNCECATLFCIVCRFSNSQNWIYF